MNLMPAINELDATHYHDIFSADGVLMVCMTIPGENTRSREPQHLSEPENGQLAGCGKEGCTGMFE